MECPRCGINNPDGVARCECGFPLGSGGLTDSSQGEPEPEIRKLADLRVGQLLHDCVGSYFTNFMKFTLILLMAFSPVIAIQIILATGKIWYELSMQGMISIFIGLLFTQIALVQLATGGIIYFVFRRQKGEQATLKKSLQVVAGRLLQLLAIAFTTELVMMVVSIVPFLLIFLLIPTLFSLGAAAIPLIYLLSFAAAVPAIVVFCALFTAIPVCLVEKTGVIRSIKRSMVLTRKSRGRIFGLAFFIVGVNNAILFVLRKALFSEFTGLPGFYVSYGIELLLSIGFSGLLAAASALVYYQLKIQTEGSDAVQLASIFD